MGTPSTSIVRHRRPDGSRNTAASAVVVTASVAARDNRTLPKSQRPPPYDRRDPSSPAICHVHTFAAEPIPATDEILLAPTPPTPAPDALALQSGPRSA